MNKSYDTGYLQHGSIPGPFHTEKVLIRERGWPHAGQWQAYFKHKWRVVHVNQSRLWIVYQGVKINIKIEGV